MTTWQRFSAWFWNPDIWLPPNVTWAELVPNDEVNYANWNDLWTYPIFMAFCGIFLRFIILDKLFYGPLAAYGGLKDVKPRPVEPNPIIEELYYQYKNKPPENELTLCAQKLDWTRRRVERWLRLRAAMGRVNKFTKFKECAWQFTYYTFIFFYGLYVMSSKPWLWDINHCWYDYPHHSVDYDVWWYYMFSLAFYWSMTFTHFFESKRKDFWQMFFHHLVTICLITFSWTCNLIRVGTLVLIIHDCADIPLQAAKMFIYLDKTAICDAVFALFAVLWIATRVGIYPIWIVRNTLFEATNIVPMFPAYYIFNSLLILLLVLHVYWTYFILRIIVNSAVKGKVEDDRSSSEDSILEHDSCDDNERKTK